MINVLLIDDLADQGWKEILHTILDSKSTHLQVETTVSDAIKTLSSNTFDLIFLDLRFGEQDHFHSDITKFGGYKILMHMKSSFNSPNFATPIILLTATNKIWNVEAMLQHGADSYYIKEHPEIAFDLEFSRKNYLNLKESIPRLLDLNKRRRSIWNQIQRIISADTIEHPNIKSRIEEKLKIGYGMLFTTQSTLEKRVLLYHSELVAFIVFWSILEDYVKDCFKDSWDRSTDLMKENRWTLKDGTEFIEPIISINKIKQFRVGITWNHSRKHYEVKESVKDEDDNWFQHPTLRIQMWGILLLGKKWKPEQIKKTFRPLREYRNKADFIHNSVRSVFTEPVVSSSEEQKETFKKVEQLLSFLEELICN